jgi:hypothetical protein
MDQRITGWVMENPPVREALDAIAGRYGGNFRVAFTESARRGALEAGEADVVEQIDALAPNTLVVADVERVLAVVHPDGRVDYRDDQPGPDFTVYVEDFELGPDEDIDLADTEAVEPPACPACGGPGVPLGALGRRAHFRCRNCGIDFSHLEEG